MDIVWKIIAGVAALFLAVAAVFGYLNRQDLLAEQELLKRAEANLQETQDTMEETLASLKENEDGFASAEEARSLAETKTNEATAETGEVEANTADVNRQSADVEKNIAEVEEQIAKIGTINELLAKIKEVNEGIAALETEIASDTQTLDITLANNEAMKEEIRRFRELERRQRLSIMEDDFKANVASVFPTWGFVILNKGNKEGVLTDAELQIERGDGPVGKLKVTRVEDNRAVAYVIKETWPEGDAPRPGDLITKAPLPDLENPEVEGGGADPGALPEGGGVPLDPNPIVGAPDGGAPMDPFGADPAPAPAPAPGDPFGADPAPAPAPPSGDPFGGGGTPAPPAETPAPAEAPAGGDAPHHQPLRLIHQLPTFLIRSNREPRTPYEDFPNSRHGRHDCVHRLRNPKPKDLR